MSFFLKSFSRSVHEEEQPISYKPEIIINEDRICCSSTTTTSLTVWRKSLVISCNGFTVYGSNGDLVFRVDNYCGGRPDDLTLMDGLGKPILTVNKRKKLGGADSWLVYEGEVIGAYCARTQIQKRPVWCVKKHNKNILQGNQNVLAYVFRGQAASTIDHKRYAYVVEGSYTQRSCKVVDESKTVVAEIKKKEAMVGGVSFGVDVFVLTVQPGFDPGYAMALVLILDQMFS